MSEECRANVREECQGQPAKCALDQTIATPNLKGQQDQCYWNNQEGNWQRDEQVECRRNRSKIGSDIDRIRKQQGADSWIYNPRRIMLFKHASQALAAHHSYFCTQVLDHRHERKRENGCPQGTVAKRGSRSGIGSDP